MCGRFVSSSPPDELARYFGAAAPEVELDGPNFNVAPTDDVYVVHEDARGDRGEAGRRLGAFHWGLVPSWAKDLSVGNRMINARAESLGDKAAFRRPFAKRRCLVPADGFYEWSAVPGRRRKQPWFIHRTDGEPLALAGLWEVWRDPGAGEGARWVRSCAIVTTDANRTLAPLHDRMPVVLPPRSWDEWLDPANEDVASLARLLVPAPDELLTYHPVSTDVSDVRNDGAHLIEPVDLATDDGAGAQGRLLDLPPVRDDG